MPSTIAKTATQQAPNARVIGTKGEAAALSYLEQRGLILKTKNYCCKVGEIDLILFDPKNNMLVFTEVKQRKNSTFGTATETVTKGKQKKIIRTAKHYLVSTHQESMAMRFDVIGIQCHPLAAPSDNDINWIQGAFYAYE